MSDDALDRATASERAWILAAPKPGAPTAELVAFDRATIARGKSRGQVRLRVDSLPFKSGAIDHLVAVGFLRAATGNSPKAAFGEIRRALRDEGSFVYGEPDVDGTFAKDHLSVREMGLVPAPMDTIPELAHVPWRLLVAFKPLTRSQAAAERGHDTH